MLVSCDSCEARYDYPDNKLRGRGAKFRCSRCGATVVVFPANDVAMATDHEPTTEDWSEQPPLPTRDGPPPVRNSLLDGVPVHPPGTVPPIQRASTPRLGIEPTFAPPLGESALSVTPPPPRAIRQPHHPVSDFVREAAGTVPPPMINEAVRFGPPPRSTGTGGTAGGAADRFVAGSPARGTPAPAPVAYSPPTMSLPPPTTTASGAPNRTGPTGGAPPPRSTDGYPQQQGHTDPGVPQGTYPPLGSIPPWQAYGYPTWTHNPDPRQQFPTPYGPYGFDPRTGVPAGTHPGAPTHPGAMTHTGAPAMTRPAMAYGPVGDASEPQGWAWMPINHGLDQRALLSIITAALIVGFVGSCAGIISGRTLDVFTASSVNQPQVPPPSRVMVENPAPAGTQPVRNEPSPAFQVEE